MGRQVETKVTDAGEAPRETRSAKLRLADIENLEVDTLTPNEVGKCLRCMPYSINLQAQADPKKLGFPVVVVGSRVLIPKEGFLRFMRGEAAAEGGKA